MSIRFRDRSEAGRKLAAALSKYEHRTDVLILALPRGGVVVASEVASRLGAPLDIFVVRKLGTPGHRELAMGAVASGGQLVLNREVIDLLGLTKTAIERAVAVELKEVERRERAYRGARPPFAVKGRTVILVDDGAATGSTFLAALVALRRQQPQKLIAAFPVGAAETVAALADHADEVICLETPRPFRALSLWYSDFAQVSDQEVRSLLQTSALPAERTA